MHTTIYGLNLIYLMWVYKARPIGSWGATFGCEFVELLPAH
jgi:hypothetical protein